MFHTLAKCFYFLPHILSPFFLNLTLTFYTSQAYPSFHFFLFTMVYIYFFYFDPSKLLSSQVSFIHLIHILFIKSSLTVSNQFPKFILICQNLKWFQRHYNKLKSYWNYYKNTCNIIIFVIPKFTVHARIWPDICMCTNMFLQHWRFFAADSTFFTHISPSSC